MKKLLLFFILLLFVPAARLSAAPVVLLRNTDALLPLTDLEEKHAAIIRMPSDRSKPVFERMVARYMPMATLTANRNAEKVYSDYNLFFLCIDRNEEAEALRFLRAHPRVESHAILVFSYKPAPSLISSLKSLAVLSSDNDAPDRLEKMAQMIFGGAALPGNNAAPIRLGYASPNEMGMDSLQLCTTTDSLIKAAIEEHAFPGCQLLVAKNGKIVLEKSYGYQTYSELTPVDDHQLYDLASLSKIFGATLALMKLVEEGEMDLDAPFSTYWKPFRRPDKQRITLRELLAHQSGLPASVVPLKLVRNDTTFFAQDAFRYTPNDEYPVKVYHNMFLKKSYRDKLLQSIAEIPLRSKRYRYTDLPFMLFPSVIGQLTGTSYEKYLEKEFYAPLGAHLLFNPADKVPLNQIVPTENDEYFRFATVRGYVHDESAALLGGVSGNAGLFSNAGDLAKICQMLLNGGTYGGRQYLKPETIAEFIRTQYPQNENRRGLGFDRPLPGNDTLSMEECYPAACVSPDSYGHSGFTGTFFWIDPDKQLIYILLTNRVHPTRNHPAFFDSRIRYTLQQAIYDAICEDPKPTL